VLKEISLAFPNWINIYPTPLAMGHYRIQDPSHIHIFLIGEKTMVIQITQEELQKMKQILLDEDFKEALILIKVFHKRLVEQTNKGMKSHLDK
jgi:hypothetical protein